MRCRPVPEASMVPHWSAGLVSKTSHQSLEPSRELPLFERHCLKIFDHAAAHRTRHPGGYISGKGFGWLHGAGERSAASSACDLGSGSPRVIPRPALLTSRFLCLGSIPQKRRRELRTHALTEYAGWEVLVSTHTCSCRYK